MSEVAIDIAGHVFGRLTVVSRAGRDPDRKGRKARWLCRCSCGQETTVISASLRSGKSKSCGCLSSEARFTARRTHGMSKSPEFIRWAAMIGRCTNPNQAGWANYGGRGIRVCDRWMHSFENFFEDMGERPSSSHSLDRINNDGNYEPDNVRWTTRFEQNRNKRNTRLNDVSAQLIRHMARRGSRCVDIAWAFGLSASDVSQIAKGRRWKLGPIRSRGVAARPDAGREVPRGALVKITARRIEARARIGAIRRDFIAAHIATIRQDALDRDAAIDARRFRALYVDRRSLPHVPPIAESLPMQAARYAKDQPTTLTRAALVFGVSRQAVEREWNRLGYAPRWQT